MPGPRNRRLREARQLDLFGPSHVVGPGRMPTWQQLPETTRAMATNLMVRLLVEHASSDLRSGPIGGHDDL
jgi:hypothetical protein